MHKNKYFRFLAGILVVPIIILIAFTAYENYKTVEVRADLANTEAGCKDQNGLINPIPAGYVNNTATVSSATTDTNTANNSDFVCNKINYVTDLSIQKIHSPSTVVPGTNVNYIITVTNAGPSVSTAVTLTDVLPSQVNGAAATYTITSGGGSYNSTNGQWTGLNLAAGQSAALQIIVPVNNSASGTVTNNVTVSPLGPNGATDPTPDNGQTPNKPNSLDSGSTNPNGAQDQFSVTPQADLSLLKTSSGNFVAGQPATYTLKVSNAGPSSATSLSIADTLPAGITFDQTATNTANTSSGWSCSASGQNVTCTNPGPLANGANSTAIIKVNVAA